MLCEKLELFFDGELPPEEAAAVRLHTADCLRCQRELHGMMQLQALNLALVEDRARRRTTPVASNPRPEARSDARPGARSEARPETRPKARPGAGLTARRPRIYRTLMVASVVAAAAAALLLWFRHDHVTGPELASVEALPGLGPRRAIEGRLSYGGADRYRPYEVPRASGVTVEHGIPLAALARLEEHGDMHGIAAAHLLMGSREQAAHYLDSASKDPRIALDVESDRALLVLLDGDPEAALQILDRVLEHEPQHPQALWNRALALRELGLPLLAAQAFERVAALNEPGWAEEARAQAALLRRMASEQEAAWDSLLARSRAFARTGTGVSAADVAAQPGLVRNYFYDAVRVAHTRERLEALRPIATALDEQAGGHVLGDHLDRVSRSDPGRRQRVSQAFAELIAADEPAPAAARALVEAARAAGIADIELGAMRYTGAARRRVAEDLLPAYQVLASQSGDPWFVLLAAEEVAQARIERGNYAGAEHVLGQALPTCESARIDYRCIRIDYWLGAAYVGLHRVSDARRHLRNAWAHAQRAGDWGVQQGLLQQLSELSYRQDDSGTGSIAAASAYLGELTLRDPSCAMRLRQHRLLATMLVIQNRKDAARQELAQAAAMVADGTCEKPPFSLQVALAQAELTGSDASADEAARIAALQAELAAFREQAADSPGNLAFADLVEGRVLLPRDREAALALVRRAIARADERTDDVTAQRARSHGYMLLIRDASARDEHERALALIAEELGVEAARQCSVGIAAEHEVVVVARGADGALLADTQPLDSEGIPAARVIPERMRQALADCAVVDVYARAPYLGSAQLLPAAMAWRFRTRRARVEPSALPPRRVIVADVEPPARLGLPRLASHPGEPGAVMLRGPAATPAAVTRELARATEVEIHAHGILDSDVADAAFLALSPDVDGQYALTAEVIRQQRFAGAPRVLLGACHGAYTTRVFHHPSSLASAFIEAGAQTVIASPAPIPDADASAFIASLRQRLTAGQPAAVALRDERLRVTGTKARGWLDQVVVFE
jgi:tetratricopeptide (TPR) repeat protein